MNCQHTGRLEKYSDGSVRCKECERLITPNYNTQIAALRSEIANYETARQEDAKRLEQVTAEREAMREALSECVNVLRYIGSGVSAHSMAEQYSKMYSKTLSEDELKAGNERVKERYDNEVTEGLKALNGGKG